VSFKTVTIAVSGTAALLRGTEIEEALYWKTKKKSLT